MKTGLPAPGVAGRVRDVDLAGPALEPFLRDPSLSVKAPEQWPPRLRKAKVRAKPGEWQNILEGLHGLGIVKFIEDKDLVYWKGEPLLNGAFGVPKGDLTAPDFSVDTCVLRFIVSLQPSVDIQHVIRGDIERLPLFSQWLQLELLEHECFLWSADDQASAFNLYRLEDAWLPYFVLGEAAEPATLKRLGVPAGRR